MFFAWLLYYKYIRPFIKWLLRIFTGLCELQRICYGTKSGTVRTVAIEQSLYNSKSHSIQRLIEHLNSISDNKRLRDDSDIICGAVSTILIVKDVNPSLHPQFAENLNICFQQIWGYRQLLSEIEQLRITPYDNTNQNHEKKLYDLWTKLVPDEQLVARVTKQWQDIGFQGDDPKTDFRGMGMLGLENLLYFAEHYNDAAVYLLSHSRHPTQGYAFAIVGINITHLIWILFKEGAVKNFIYNLTATAISLNLFHILYANIFYKFDRFWIQSKPKNLMEFPIVWQKFEIHVRQLLQGKYTDFNENLLPHQL